MAKQPWYKRFWIRVIFTLLALFLIVFCVSLIFWGSNSSSNDIALALLAGVSAFVATGQWILPFSSEKPEQLVLSSVQELVPDSVAFRMGDANAANFYYIIEPIKDAYSTAKQALRDSSIGIGPKHGILILDAT